MKVAVATSIVYWYPWRVFRLAVSAYVLSDFCAPFDLGPWLWLSVLVGCNIGKTIFGKTTWFSTPEAICLYSTANVSRACVMLTSLLTCIQRVYATPSCLSVLWSFEGLPGLASFLHLYWQETFNFLFSCFSASDTITASCKALSISECISNLTYCPGLPVKPAMKVDNSILWAWS